MSRHVSNINKARQQKAQKRTLDFVAEVAHGKSQRQIAAEQGISQRAVRNVLARAEDLPKVFVEEHIAEIERLKAELESYRKAGKPLALSVIDRLIKLLELDARLKGTFAPSRSIHADVSASMTPELLAILAEFSGIPEADKPRAVEAAKAALRSFQKPATINIPEVLDADRLLPE